MKMLTLARRNSKEILRDPLNLGFGLGFPLVLILLLSAIQASVPVPLFEIQTLTPGVAVFGLAFITLFSATVISKDRASALLERLYTAPISAWDFILSYTLPMLPIALGQSAFCYLTAVVLGLEMSINILWALLLSVPVSVMFVALGLLFGSILNDKQVGGICGALLTNLTAWLSGAWFDLKLVGGAFETVANLLPFVHGVEMQRAALSGDISGVWPHLWWVLGYAVLAGLLAVLLFLRQMKKR